MLIITEYLSIIMFSLSKIIEIIINLVIWQDGSHKLEWNSINLILLVQICVILCLFKILNAEFN